MSEIKTIVHAEPGFRAAFRFDDDPEHVAFIPVAFWAVYPERVVALVVPDEGEELISACDYRPSWGTFFRLAGPETTDSDVEQEAEADAKRAGEEPEREDDAEALLLLRKHDFDVRDETEARIVRHFFGNIDDVRGGISPGRSRAIEHVLAAHRGRREQELK